MASRGSHYSQFPSLFPLRDLPGHVFGRPRRGVLRTDDRQRGCRDYEIPRPEESEPGALHLGRARSTRSWIQTQIGMKTNRLGTHPEKYIFSHLPSIEVYADTRDEANWRTAVRVSEVV